MKHLFFLLASLFLFSGTVQSQQALPVNHPDYQRLKAEGQLPQQAPGFYKISRNASGQTVKPLDTPAHIQIDKSASRSLSAGGGTGTESCNCFQTLDETYQVVPFDGYDAPDYRNDDGSSAIIDLPFSYCLYGDTYNQVYINTNGNISFDNEVGTFSSEAFPNNFVMVAPFWGDVDIRNPQSGLVHYKITAHYMVVIWDQVGYYSSMANLRNSFQLIITDGTDPIVPFGFNTGFCYGDMQWTTGSASGGSGGFGGTPATVGANRGNAQDYVQFGRFDQAGTAYDGPFNNFDGVSWLDNQTFFFNTCTEGGSDNVPPVPIASDICDTINLCVGQSYPFNLNFFAVEPDQTCSTTVAPDPTNGLLISANTAGNVNVVSGTFTAQLDNIGMNAVSFTCTDDGTPAASTTITAYFRVVENNFSIPITGLDSICAGTCATLTVGAFDTYEWSSGEATQSIQVCEPGGPYVVSVTVGTCVGSSPPFTVYPGVIVPPVLTAQDDTICPGQTTLLSVQDIYETYTWTNNISFVDTANAGPGSTSVTVVAENGCTATASVTVATYLNSTPVIDGVDAVCGGALAPLYTTVPYESYVWSNNATTDTVNVGPGSYTVTATDLNGCVVTSAPFVVIQNQSLTPVIVGDNHTCGDELSTISCVQNYETYTWSNGSNAPFLEQSEGTFTVTVTDAFGCSGTSAPFTITNSDPVANVLGIVPFCKHDSIMVTGDGNYESYLWYGDDGKVISETNSTYTSGDSLFLVVTDAFGCQDSAAFYVPATLPPVASFTSDPLYQTVLLPATVQYWDTSTITENDPLNAWTWTFNPNTPGIDDFIVFEQHPLINFPDTGYRVITLVVTSEIGCKDTVSSWVYIIDKPFVPNVFSPGGDGINDYFKVPFIDNYPNNLVLIYNRWGKKVFEGNNYKGDWDGDDLPSGTYFYVVSAPTLDKPLKGSVTLIRN